MVTLGADGSVIAVGTERRRVAAFPVEAVDTTGCGDAFTGALLLGLASGRDLLESTRTACAVGAIAATAVGAQSSYPFAAELAAFLREHGGAPTA